MAHNTNNVALGRLIAGDFAFQQDIPGIVEGHSSVSNDGCRTKFAGSMDDDVAGVGEVNLAGRLNVNCFGRVVFSSNLQVVKRSLKAQKRSRHFS